jgi:hypothetical protein
MSSHRDVSPLGSFRFEKKFYSSRPLGRSSTVREPRETSYYGDHYGGDFYTVKSDTTARSIGSGLKRSGAIQGRAISSINPRGFGSSISSSSRYPRSRSGDY